MDWPSELSAVRTASLVVFSIAAWSTWTRRVTLHSRYDRGTTIAVALLGIGAVLDAPWPICATASEPLTGRFYGVMVLAQMCYLAAIVASSASVYVRLLPDGALGPFLRTRIVSVAVGASAIMVLAFWRSSVPLTHSVEHLYLATPDTALSVYWCVNFGAAATLGGILSYGLYLLSDDPRSAMSNVMLISVIIASASCVLIIIWAVISGHTMVLHRLAWQGGYLGFAGFAVSAAIQWKHREGALRRKRRPSRP